MNLDPLIDINPWPFWSTDGTTLVYHKCTNSACYDLSDFSIYQVNVNTGVEKKIIAGGLFPIWIK
jgi:Tol biopolymer transport system component